MALLVFFAGAAGTRIVAANFGSSADGLGRFGLRRAGLILQILLLTRLAALDLARDLGQMLWLARTRSGARHSCMRTRRTNGTGRLGARLLGLRLLILLNLDVE